MKTRYSRGTAWVVMQFAVFGAQFVSVLIKRGQWSGPFSRMGGAALLAVAAGFAWPGVRSLGRNLTPMPEPRKTGELVTTGIYAHVRHPIYTSLIAGSFGWALVWRSWPALLFAVLQTWVLRGKARREEAFLRARFPDYTAYARRVPRFIPHMAGNCGERKSQDGATPSLQPR